MDSRELEDSLASHKAAYCYWKEIFLEAEMSKGPIWFWIGCSCISEPVVEVKQVVRWTIWILGVACPDPTTPTTWKITYVFPIP